MGVPALPWLCCGSEERLTPAACPQPGDGAEGSCPSRERENWLIFIEVQLSTACTILIKGGSFGQTGVHMGCCISNPPPAVKRRGSAAGCLPTLPTAASPLPETFQCSAHDPHKLQDVPFPPVSREPTAHSPNPRGVHLPWHSASSQIINCAQRQCSN